MGSRVDVVRSELLLLRYRAGDAAAFPELVALWERPLLYYLCRLLESEPDAWDALQDTWVRVIRSQGRLRDEYAFPAWLYTIARNTAYTMLRRRREMDALPEDDAPGGIPASGEPTLAGWDAMDIHAALARLSLPHRDVLTLHFLEGFSISEIGAITGCAEGTIKSRIHHAKRAVRARLEEQTS